jgi:hypothetical protein
VTRDISLVVWKKDTDGDDYIYSETKLTPALKKKIIGETLEAVWKELYEGEPQTEYEFQLDKYALTETIKWTFQKLRDLVSEAVSLPKEPCVKKATTEKEV